MKIRVREIGFSMAVATAFSAGPAFAQFSLKVEVEPAESGFVDHKPAESSFADGDVVTVQATPAEGYEFAGWTGDVVVSEPAMSFTVSSDLTLVANFVEVAPAEYTVTAFSNPQGAGSIVSDPAEFTYTEDSELTLTAYAIDGYVFTGWTGDIPDDADASSEVLTLIVTDNLDIEATFAATAVLDDSEGSPCGTMGILGLGMLMTLMLGMRLGRFVR